MVNRILTAAQWGGVIGSVLFSITACKSEPTTKEAAPVMRDTPGTPDEDDGRGASGADKDGHPAEIGQGVNTVFGIKIPTGMIPARGPVKVFRFEGRQPLPQVVHLIKTQVRFREEAREGEGYLFRFARVRSDNREIDLAIRIFERDGRTSLDIWQEKEYPKALPNSASTAAYRGHTVPRSTPVTQNRQMKQRRRQQLSDAMTIMRKLESNQPLTEAERKSDLFN